MKLEEGRKRGLVGGWGWSRIILKFFFILVYKEGFLVVGLRVWILGVDVVIGIVVVFIIIIFDV